jgi:cbb3-type cytochrome oxidase subunit 3
MKKQIFLYLFLFAVLVIVFLFMNSKRKFEDTEQEIQKLESQVNDLENENDSLSKLEPKKPKFTMTSNDKSRAFFQSQNINPDSLAMQIESALISKNRPSKDNELVPYSGMRGVMRINSIQVLNNRWVMAEFTDSVYWGEAIIAYRVKDDGELAFETLDGVIYPN